MCLKEQYNSIRVCWKAQESGEWRKAGTETSEKVFGREELQKAEIVARLVHTK
jgi:hypothetical protein